jgi:hypothetical protein
LRPYHKKKKKKSQKRIGVTQGVGPDFKPQYHKKKKKKERKKSTGLDDICDLKNYNEYALHLLK